MQGGGHRELEHQLSGEEKQKKDGVAEGAQGGKNESAKGEAPNTSEKRRDHIIEYGEEKSKRTIKSYVLRQTHMQERHVEALENLYPKYGLTLEDGLLDFAKLFGNSNPVILEVGFGMGDTTATMAKNMPDRNFIGIEVHKPGVGNLLAIMEEEGISNIKVVRDDAIDVLKKMIPDGSLEGVHVYFPDPWPKKRHHKRRLIQTPFVKIIMQKLRKGGYIHLATDWKEYADHMSEVLLAESGLETSSTDPTGRSPRPEWRPLTKYENKGVEKGHEIADFIFVKK